jgi:hypothetical protein
LKGIYKIPSNSYPCKDLDDPPTNTGKKDRQAFIYSLIMPTEEVLFFTSEGFVGEIVVGGSAGGDLLVWELSRSCRLVINYKKKHTVDC